MISYSEFENILNDLSDKKIGELSMNEIAKYILVAEELDSVEANAEEDEDIKQYKFNKDLLDDLSYTFVDSIFRLLTEEILFYNDLHEVPEELEH